MERTTKSCHLEGPLIAIACILAGVAMLLAVPDGYEGPLLVRLNAAHAIRLVDALGLLLAVPAVCYLEVIGLRWLWRRAARRADRS